MKKLYFLSVLCLSIITIPLYSQTKEELEAMRQDFENYKQQERENFKQFVKERDRDFAAYIEQEMKNIELFKSQKQDRKPGPDKIPRFKPETQQIETQTIPLMEVKDPEISKAPPPAPYNIKPVIKLPATVEPKPDVKFKTATFDFYGTKQRFHYDPEIHQNPGSSTNAEVIAAYFETLSKTDYFPLIESLIEQHNKLNLNDWAYLKLCESLAENIAVTDREKNLLHWFLLLKSGYKTKIAYYNDDISIMIPTKQKLFGLPFYAFNDQTYYILNPGLSNIFTYTKDYPGADAVFDLSMPETPVLPLSLGIQMLTNKEGENIKLVYNKNLKTLYNDFPQADINMFFQAGISPVARESLLNYFEPLFKDKSDKEKVNILLDFVQHQFAYQTDQEQFGKEKFFFPEELFMYPYADCEDRSVFFAWLVREFTSLDLIGVDYPGHIATAVHFPDQAKGHYLTWKDRTYTICDPTYIGAPVGLSMPQFERQKAAVIPVFPVQNPLIMAENIWAKIYEYGGFRNNIEQTAALDDEGNMYLCGSFNKTLTFPEKTLSSDQKRSGFVASFSPQGKLINAIALDDAPLVSPQNVMIHNNSIFISGNQKHRSKKTVFLAELSKTLHPVWSKTIEPDKESKAFEVKLDPEHKNLVENNINPHEIIEENALRVLPDGSIELYAHNTMPIYNTKKPAENLSAYDMAKLWKHQSDEYRKNAYHKSVSGFLAFIHTLQTHQRSVSGNEIVASLNAFDPSFSTEHARLNHNLKKIESVTCDGNMINVNIKEGSSILLGPIILANNSKIQLQNYHSGNLKMICLSGVQYKSLFREHPVKSMKIFKANGDIVLEYNKKYEKALLSTTKDVLK